MKVAEQSTKFTNEDKATNDELILKDNQNNLLVLNCQNAQIKNPKFEGSLFR